MAIKIDGNMLTVVRGDLAQMELEIFDDLVAYPLTTGDVVTFDVRSTPDAADSLLTKVITEFTEGVAHLELTPEDTTALEVGIYSYQLKLTLPDFRGTHTLLAGNLNVINWAL